METHLGRHCSWHGIMVLHNSKCVPSRKELCRNWLHLASRHSDGMRHLSCVMQG
jgi:hypothetical protein